MAGSTPVTGMLALRNVGAAGIPPPMHDLATSRSRGRDITWFRAGVLSMNVVGEQECLGLRAGDLRRPPLLGLVPALPLERRPGTGSARAAGPAGAPEGPGAPDRVRGARPRPARRRRRASGPLRAGGARGGRWSCTWPPSCWSRAVLRLLVSDLSFVVRLVLVPLLAPARPRGVAAAAAARPRGAHPRPPMTRPPPSRSSGRSPRPSACRRRTPGGGHRVPRVPRASSAGGAGPVLLLGWPLWNVLDGRPRWRSSPTSSVTSSSGDVRRTLPVALASDTLRRWARVFDVAPGAGTAPCTR